MSPEQHLQSCGCYIELSHPGPPFSKQSIYRSESVFHAHSTKGQLAYFEFCTQQGNKNPTAVPPVLSPAFERCQRQPFMKSSKNVNRTATLRLLYPCIRGPRILNNRFIGPSIYFIPIEPRISRRISGCTPRRSKIFTLHPYFWGQTFLMALTPIAHITSSQTESRYGDGRIVISLTHVWQELKS